MSTARFIVLTLIIVTAAIGVIIWDTGREVVMKRRLGKNYEGPLAGW